MRALGYARTSHEDKKEKSLSIEAQADDIRAFCKGKGWELLDVLADRGKSGATTEGRDEFQKAIQWANEGRFDCLVVKRLDRFSRSSRDQNEVCYALADLGIVIWSVDEGEFDYRKEETELTGGIHGILAQTEWRRIRKRFHEGKQKQTRDRGNPCTPKVPWGYSYDKEQREWFLNGDKQEILVEIAKRYADGVSLIAIAIENAHKRDRALYAGISSESSLRRVLRKACGLYERKIDGKVYKVAPDEHLIQYNKLPLQRKAKAKKVPDGEPFIINLPGPLLTDSRLRQRVAKTFEANKRKGMPATHEYYLGGKIFCATCGRRLDSEASKAGQLAYRHRFRLRRASAPGGYLKIKCDESFNKVDARLIEGAVFWKLFDHFGDRKAMEETQRAAFPDDAERQALLKKQARLKGELKKDGEVIQKYLDEFESGKLKGPDADKRIEDRRQNSAKLEADIRAIDGQLGALPSAEEIKAAAEKAKGVIDQLKKEYRTASHGRSLIRIRRGPINLGFLAGAKHLFDTVLERVTVKFVKQDKEWKYTINGILDFEVKGVLEEDGGAVYSVSREHER